MPWLRISCRAILICALSVGLVSIRPRLIHQSKTSSFDQFVQGCLMCSPELADGLEILPADWPKLPFPAMVLSSF